MRSALLLAAVPVAARGTAAARATPAERARALVAQMTLDEKIQLLHGTGWGNGSYVGNVAGIPRLGVPNMNLNDGPQGYHCGGIGRCPAGTTTAFPSGLNVAATFDVEAARRWGTAMGKEFYAKGANVILGPGLCLARVPGGGRNFEYMSGEDPYLGKQLVQGAVQGIQGEGVIATVKHYVLNNQETQRNSISAAVDERTFMELYLPPYQGAADAGVGSVMCSYNKINGTYACSNNATLNTYLKGVAGFEGYVMTDWNAAHGVTIDDGLDQECPGAGNFGAPLKTAVLSGQVSNATVDASVARVLAPLYQVGLMDTPNPNANSAGALAANVSTAFSIEVARQVAEDSTVLLKNDGALLPIGDSVTKVVLVGLGGGLWANRYVADFIVGGLGSGSIAPSYQPMFPKVLAGRVAVDHHGSADEAAQQAAAAADLVIVGLSTTSGEGADRVNVSFDCPLPHSPPQTQDELVWNISKVAGKKTVVAATASGTVVMPWRDSVGAILLGFMPGQMFGEALTRLLFGDASPSGRLPVTIGNKDNEYGWTEEQFPGVNGTVTYSEGLFVGYRWYDKHDVQPAFPFGHGLGYTTFTYSGLAARAAGSGATVTVTVANAGAAAGREVAQLYLTPPGDDPFEPARVLKGFHKTASLAPGDKEVVTFALTERDLSLWVGGRWTKSTGAFGVAVGASSRDIRLRTTLQIS